MMTCMSRWCPKGVGLGHWQDLSIVLRGAKGSNIAATPRHSFSLDWMTTSRGPAAGGAGDTSMEPRGWGHLPRNLITCRMQEIREEQYQRYHQVLSGDHRKTAGPVGLWAGDYL